MKDLQQEISSVCHERGIGIESIAFNMREKFGWRYNLHSFYIIDRIVHEGAEFEDESVTFDDMLRLADCVGVCTKPYIARNEQKQRTLKRGRELLSDEATYGLEG